MPQKTELNTQLLELRLLRHAKPNLSKDRVNYSTAPVPV